MTLQTAHSVLQLIGSTPVVRLDRVSPPGAAQMWGKLEFFNPGGSLKDRISLNMIETAERDGLLSPGVTIIEPTSGNTGIGLAMVAACKGYRLILVMPDTMSLERRKILKAYGAEIILTPGAEGMKGAISKAEEMAREIKASFMPQQFRNPANPQAHRRTTAREILAQVGNNISAFVAGVGTGGTITGVGEVLKQEIAGIQVIAVEPADSPVLSGGKPGPHKIQGIGAGFVPEILNRDVIDRIITVQSADAVQTARSLARHEGLLVGISSGANVWAATQVALELGPGHTVVVIICDTGERYLSTDLFEA